MSPFPGAGGALKILHDELRQLQNQRNVKDWNYHGYYMDTYRVVERNIIIRLTIERKWLSVLNDPLPIPRDFEFVGIWKNDDRTEFNSDIVLEHKRVSDGEEILKLDWEGIVEESDELSSNSATCFLELSLPDDEEALKKRVAHSTEEYNTSLQAKGDVDKINKLITTINRGERPDSLSEINSFPSPEKYSYELDDGKDLPSKIEHIERVEYNLDLEKEGFEKERTSKTYITIEDLDINDENKNIRLNYDN